MTQKRNLIQVSYSNRKEGTAARGTAAQKVRSRGHKMDGGGGGVSSVDKITVALNEHNKETNRQPFQLKREEHANAYNNSQSVRTTVLENGFRGLGAYSEVRSDSLQKQFPLHHTSLETERLTLRRPFPQRVSLLFFSPHHTAPACCGAANGEMYRCSVARSPYFLFYGYVISESACANVGFESVIVQAEPAFPERLCFGRESCDWGFSLF